MEHIRTTFGILEEWCVLFGNCYTCDHIRRLDRWDLPALLWQGRIKSLEHKLICNKCRNRQFNGF